MSIPKSVNSFAGVRFSIAASRYLTNRTGIMKVIIRLDDGSIPAIMTYSGGTNRSCTSLILRASSEDLLYFLKSVPSIWN